MKPTATAAAAAALVIAGVVGVVQWTSEDPAPVPAPGAGAPGGSAQVPVPGATAPSGTPTGSETPGGPAASLAGTPTGTPSLQPAEDARFTAARGALEAMLSVSYRDPKPTAWLARMRPYVTPAYYRDLTATFGSTRADNREWREIVDGRVETRMTVNHQGVSTWWPATDKVATLVLTYTQSRRAGDGDWVTGAEQTKFVRVRSVDGTWLVSGIRSGSDRRDW